MIKPPFLETAQKAINKHYPGYKCAFVAGSMLRGQETATSDIDIVVIYDDDFEDVHRNSVIENGWPVEFFVHNVKANDYFMEQDRKRGMYIMMDMVANGLPLPELNEMARERQLKASEMIRSGKVTIRSRSCPKNLANVCRRIRPKKHCKIIERGNDSLSFR